MKGADNFYDVFKGRSQQVGRLYLQLHTHARGKCFEIFLLPEGATVEGSNIGGTKDAVEVYGMTGGQRGWTESYGWIHKGKWVDDFNNLFAARKAELQKKRATARNSQEIRKIREKERINSLLSDY